MRQLLIAAAFILAPGAAFAFCPVIADPNSAAATNAAQQQLVACQQNELRFAARLQQQKLDFEAALRAQQANFDAQLRLQHTFDAARPPVTFPQF